MSNSKTLSAKERFKIALSTLAGMKQVEALVTSKLVSEVPLLQEIGHYLLSLGGKRLRPVLALLVARTLGKESPPQTVIEVAAGIELIHMATLMHDDIIDKSPLRRHKESPYLKYGSDNTLLCGDFLLTRAFSLCAHLDNVIIDATEQACIALTEGEILETPLWSSNHSIQTSTEIARKKTAALFKLAALSASHLCGGSTNTTAAWAEFGEKLGIAFQILDDVLDVISTEAQLGKKAGIDIHERKPSLVNILWLATGSKLAVQLKTKPGVDEEKYIQEALVELKSSSVIAQAKQSACSYAEQAQMALQRALQMSHSDGLLIDNKAAQALQALIEYTLERME